MSDDDKKLVSWCNTWIGRIIRLGLTGLDLKISDTGQVSITKRLDSYEKILLADADLFQAVDFLHGMYMGLLEIQVQEVIVPNNKDLAIELYRISEKGYPSSGRMPI